MTKITDMAVYILRTTRDGNDLHPTDLYLVQCAVNKCLNVTGDAEFEKLYHIVQTGEYRSEERWKHDE